MGSNTRKFAESETNTISSFRWCFQLTPYFKDFLLPSGSLREWRSGAKRADIIIVTKCPDETSEADRQKYIQRIAPLPHQIVFFSRYAYGNPYYLYNGNQRINLTKDMTAVLISGIAQPDYLIYHLEIAQSDWSRVESLRG